MDDLHEWIATLNRFAQLQVKDWLKGGEGKDGRPGEALIAYQSRPAMALCTVTWHLIWTSKCTRRMTSEDSRLIGSPKSNKNVEPF